MLNQKGQAFSVFELMIAAIVAVAILFVLLPILTNIIAPTGDAKTSIGNTLASVKSGGTLETGVFSLTKGTVISSSYFSAKGFDKCTVIFDKGNFATNITTTGNDPNTTDTDLCSNSFVYTGTNPVNAKAKVICEATPSQLAATVNLLKTKTATNSAALPDGVIKDGTLALADFPSCGAEDGEYDVCCLVVLMKS